MHLASNLSPLSPNGKLENVAIAKRRSPTRRALAAQAAERANQAAKGEDAAVLDTLARVQFMNGKKPESIATQEKAVALADGDMKSQLEKALASYQAGKLPEVEE